MASNQQNHILVIRSSAMGDVAMTVPVLRVLLDQYPELKITVLTKPAYAAIFKDVDRVSVFSADFNTDYKGVFGLYQLAQKLLKNNSFDAIADLHNVMRSKALKVFLKAKTFAIIDKGRKCKRALTLGRVFKQLKTTHERYADVFKTLGYPVDLSKPVFPEPVHLSKHLNDLLKLDSKKVIGVAPFAAFKGKMYPLDLMKQVIESLSKDYKIVLFGGGKQEEVILDYYQKKYNNTINLAGKVSFEEQLDVISNLDLMLSMDSSNGHLAAMYGVKVITIWGVTHPYAGFAPFNQPEEYSLLADRDKFPKIPTSIFGNKYPNDYEMAAGSIRPKAIIDKVKAII